MLLELCDAVIRLFRYSNNATKRFGAIVHAEIDGEYGAQRDEFDCLEDAIGFVEAICPLWYRFSIFDIDPLMHAKLFVCIASAGGDTVMRN